MPVPGSTVYPTVAQIRAIGTWVQSSGLITGMTLRESEDQYDLRTGPNLTFLITSTSLKEQHMVPTDTEIVLRVPPINKSTCHANPDWAGVDISHRDNVGVYGPSAALAHDDWTGSGSVGTANGAGAFTVTGTGKLELTIPTNYEWQLGKVATGSAAAAPPIIYMTRRADHWYTSMAVPVPEGVYCWLGWERLHIPITCPVASDTLTATAYFRTYTFTDNHLSDSSRPSTFAYVATDRSAIYTIPVVTGAQSAPVTLVAPNTLAYPFFERVESLELRGFDSGNWVIGEPELVLVSGMATHARIKTFEGYEYQDGGMSVHADASYEYYDANESNAGHANFAELTMRYFDYVQGAGTGLDLTTARQLDSWCNLANVIGDAFDVSVDTAAFSAALIDSASPSTQLSPAWGFDLCHPYSASPPTPLEQGVDDGAGNCGIRATTWAMVVGTKYKVMTDAIRGGRYHGRALTAASQLDPSQGGIQMFQKLPGGSWTPFGSQLTADEHGHWDSGDLPEVASYSGAGLTRYLYKVARPFADAESTSANVYSREYQTADAFNSGVQRNPDLAQLQMGTGQYYLAYRDDAQAIRLARSRNLYNWGGLADTVIGDASHDYPALLKDPRGPLYCAATKSGTPSVVRMFRSFDDGRTWVSAAHSFVGQHPDLTRGPNGLNYLTVYSGGYQTLYRGTGWLSNPRSSVAIGSGAAARAGVAKHVYGGMVAGLPSSGQTVNVWTSADDGVSWTAQPTTLTGDALSVDRGHDGQAYAAALSGGRATLQRSQRNFQTDATWPSVLAAGGTTLQTTGLIASGLAVDRPAMVKGLTAGTYLAAVVVRSEQLEVYASDSDGQTFRQIV